PGCTRRAARLLQLDHAEEHPHGPTTAANCGPLCTECHQRKTAGLLDITDSNADGSATFRTALGQTIRIPARPYLPRPAEAQALDTQIDQPPF
ncbi:MAG: HNH endonuclease, partial [Candidatus Nanopelagicales bacterium]